MEPIFIILLSVVSFLLGYFIQERIYKRMNLDDKCRKTIKKHKDIVNWLKSELSGTKKQKLGKRNIDNNKVKLLELLIRRLEK